MSSMLRTRRVPTAVHYIGISNRQREKRMGVFEVVDASQLPRGRYSRSYVHIDRVDTITLHRHSTQGLSYIKVLIEETTSWVFQHHSQTEAMTSSKARSHPTATQRLKRSIAFQGAAVSPSRWPRVKPSKCRTPTAPRSVISGHFAQTISGSFSPWRIRALH